MYALFIFAHMYIATGGAIGVGIIDGQYVYRYQSRILRPITQAEYKMFPRLEVRLASAWAATRATFFIWFFSGTPTRNEGTSHA